MERGFGEKCIMGAAAVRESWWQRKARESRAHRDMHKMNTAPKPLYGKTKGDDFHEFLQAEGFKDWSFKGPWASLG